MKVNLDNVKIEQIPATLTNRIGCIKGQLVNAKPNTLYDINGEILDIYWDSTYSFYLFERMNGEYLLYITYDKRGEAPEYMYTGKAGKVYRYAREYNWVIYVNDKFIVDGVINE